MKTRRGRHRIKACRNSHVRQSSKVSSPSYAGRNQDHRVKVTRRNQNGSGRRGKGKGRTKTGRAVTTAARITGGNAASLLERPCPL